MNDHCRINSRDKPSKNMTEKISLLIYKKQTCCVRANLEGQ